MERFSHGAARTQREANRCAPSVPLRPSALVERSDAAASCQLSATSSRHRKTPPVCFWLWIPRAPLTKFRLAAGPAPAGSAARAARRGEWKGGFWDACGAAGAIRPPRSRRQVGICHGRMAPVARGRAVEPVPAGEGGGGQSARRKSGEHFRALRRIGERTAVGAKAADHRHDVHQTAPPLQEGHGRIGYA